MAGRWKTGGTAGAVEHGLDTVHGGHVDGLKHDSGHILSVGHGVELCCPQRGTPGWGYSFGCHCCPVPRLRGGWDSLLDVGEGVPGGVVSNTVSLAHVEVL